MLVRDLEMKNPGLGFLGLNSWVGSLRLGFFGSDSWVWTPSQTFTKTLSKPMRFEPKSQILTRYSRSDPRNRGNWARGTRFFLQALHKLARALQITLTW